MANNTRKRAYAPRGAAPVYGPDGEPLGAKKAAKRAAADIGRRGGFSLRRYHPNTGEIYGKGDKPRSGLKREEY